VRELGTRATANIELPNGVLSGMANPRVFTIPASAPFVPTLIRALIDGTLVPGFPAGAVRSRSQAPPSICLHVGPAGWCTMSSST
jgi:hypothetical protein